MTDITAFWTLSRSEQQCIQKEIEQEIKNQEKAQIPAPSTLSQVFDTDTNLAICASSLFILIVENCCNFGDGYDVRIITLAALFTTHKETVAQVEQFLEETAPYKQNSRVWIPLPSYNPGMRESDFLKKLLEKRDA